jgi:2-polyprenyl-3-methyl-5-hydroxy-6-metoxy-1,4-benzoquinol methylase
MEPKDWNKLVEKYHEEVISPFQPGVQNPLFQKLDQVEDTQNKIIADIGCGRGEIIEQLASKFKELYAMDFSPAMIEMAKKQSGRENIRFFVKDMRELSEFKEMFDVVICANSVLMPNTLDVARALASVNLTLKQGGKFFGIFPSMDSILFQGFLILEEQIKKGEEKPVENTQKILEAEKYDFLQGTFTDKKQVQKFYYEMELRVRLKDAGFKKIVLSKVYYPWGNDSGYVDFPDRPRMWDWFVVAEK